MWMQFMGFMLYSAALLFLGVWLGANEARKRFAKKPDFLRPKPDRSICGTMSLRKNRGDFYSPPDES